MAASNEREWLSTERPKLEGLEVLAVMQFQWLRTYELHV
jgi:hypothetical protein